jgi:hypothetical protein
MLVVVMPSGDSSTLRSIKKVLALWPIIIGLIVVLGWATDTDILKWIGDFSIPMYPTSAVAFIVLGSIIFAGYENRIIVHVFALILLVTMALKCADIFYGTSF